MEPEVAQPEKAKMTQIRAAAKIFVNVLILSPPQLLYFRNRSKNASNRASLLLAQQKRPEEELHVEQFLAHDNIRISSHVSSNRIMSEAGMRCQVIP